MTKKLVGLFASVALLGSGMALAGDDKQKGQQQTGAEQQWGEDAYGGAGQPGQMGQQRPGQMGQMQQQKDLTGTVVKSSARELHVRTPDGFIVPVKINNQTQFQDATIKRAKDLKEGQQVRASLNIQGTDNVAQSISLATGMGGAGMPHDQMKDKPMQPGTGGTGLDDREFDPDLDPGVGEDIGTEPIEQPQ